MKKHFTVDKKEHKKIISNYVLGCFETVSIYLCLKVPIDKVHPYSVYHIDTGSFPLLDDKNTRKEFFILLAITEEDE